MKRWHEEVSRYDKQKEVYCHHVYRGYKPGMEGSPRLNQMGRYRKKKALDCGIPHCGICHSDKFPKRSKHEHEILSDLSFREQLNELD